MTDHDTTRPAVPRWLNLDGLVSPDAVANVLGLEPELRAYVNTAVELAYKVGVALREYYDQLDDAERTPDDFEAFIAELTGVEVVEEYATVIAAAWGSLTHGRPDENHVRGLLNKLGMDLDFDEIDVTIPKWLRGQSPDEREAVRVGRFEALRDAAGSAGATEGGEG